MDVVGGLVTDGIECVESDGEVGPKDSDEKAELKPSRPPVAAGFDGGGGC